MFFKDARDYQIILLTTFLCLGIGTRDWSINKDLILVLWLSTLLTQLISAVMVKSEQIGWKSAIITSLGLSLLLRANSYSTMVIAGCLAISSKFIFRFQNKHFFNPANFGIISALTLTTDAWVSPGQWGTDWWYLILFLSSGGMILKKVGRWDTSASFLLAYTSLVALRNIWLGWSWDVVEHQLSSGSLLLFAFFMITDPRSIPNAQISRILWAVCLALVTFSLQTIWFIPTALFWSLFILSPLTVLLDWIWSAPYFTWQNSKQPLSVNKHEISTIIPSLDS